MQRFADRSRATTRWLVAPWLTAFLALSAHAAPEARFVAAPLQGDPCVAPCAVHFDAIGDGASATVDPAYTREFHTLLFEWDFGEPGAGTWSVTGADKNKALGAIAGHVYALPGTYTVTLAVTNPAGETSVAQTPVAIADPDAEFSASETWCFANSGVPGGAGFESCPSSLTSRQVVIGAGTQGGFDAALGASFCDAGAGKARCMFRAGDTFLGSGLFPLAPSAPGPGLISRFGSGANPRIEDGGGFLALGDGWTVAHFDVELDTSAADPRSLFLLAAERQRVLVWDVRGRGLRAACFESSTGSVAAFHSDLIGIVELDCQSSPVSTLAGLFLRAERVLVLGNSIDNAYEGQFALRTVHFPRSIVQHNRIQRPQEDATNQRNAIQIRAWAGTTDPPTPTPTPPSASPTEWVIVSDNVISQDNAVMSIRTCQTNTCTDDAGAPDLRDVLFERNFLFLSTGGAGGLGRQAQVFWLQGGDLTVRNNVVDLQGVDPTNPNEQIRLVGQEANEPSAPGLLDDRVHVLNNVIYFDDATERTFRFCSSFAAGSDHECRNNLAWLPNQTGPRFADDGQFLASNNVFAAENPFVGPVPGQGQSSAEDFEPSAQASGIIDLGYDFGDGPSQVRLDFAGRCRPADGDQSGTADWDVGAFERSAGTDCRLVSEPGGCTTGFAKGSFSVNETSPGQEKLEATLARGPLVTQASFGDPSAVDGTVVALYVYDDAGAQVAALEVDRAGESCGTKPCWKPLGGVPPTGNGFGYKDAAGSASGVRSLKLGGGAAGKSSLSVSAANQARKGQTALPTGIAAALVGTTSVRLEVHTSDAACFSAALFDVIRQEPGFFQAR